MPTATKSLANRTTARGRLRSPLEAGMRLLCTELEGVNLASKQIDGGSLLIDGTLEAKGLVKDIENKVTVMDFEAPFSLSVDLACGDKDCVEADVAIEDFSARFVSTEEVELDANLRLAIVVKKQRKMKLITNLIQGEEKKENNSAISVYIPIEGEDLWTVSKRLNASPEKIMELNKDVEFPLTGNERILVYRQIKKDY